MCNEEAIQPDSLKRKRAFVALAAALAFLAKLALALKTYGTNDVYTYHRFGLWSRVFGADLYNFAPDLNHPPSMLHILSGIIWLADHAPLGFAFWLRFPGILADAGTVWLVCLILGTRLAARPVYLAVLLLAIAPTNILVSGFHGNTDPVMIFFVLLTVWLVGYRDNAAAGGVAFGVALCIKIVPVVLVPVLFFALPSRKKRLVFFGTVAAVVLMAWAPYLYQQPAAVYSQVFGYKSSYGLWGLSWIFRAMANEFPASVWVSKGFMKVGTPILIAAILALSIRMKFLKVSLYTQVGMVFFLFFTLTSGFAVQYMVWLTPWLAEAGVFPVACFLLTGSVFLFVVYNYWNLGMPWYLAIAYPWASHQYFQILCWVSVVVLAASMWLRIRRDTVPELTALRRIPVVFRLAAAALAVALILINPAIKRIRQDKLAVTPAYAEDVVLYTQADELHNMAGELYKRGRSQEADEAELQANHLTAQAQTIYNVLVREQPARLQLKAPEDLVDDSLAEYNRGDYAQCVFDATESLKLRPGMPAAWNNISLCNFSLGNYDAAATAAAESLRLEPESDELRQYLNQALAAKRQSH